MSLEVKCNLSHLPHVSTNMPTVYLRMKWRYKQPSASQTPWLVEGKGAQVGLIGGWHIAGSGKATLFLHIIDTVKYKAPTELKKKSSDFDETTSFWARELVLLQCSAAWLEFWTASLILCQRIQGPAGTWDVFWRAFFPCNSFFGVRQM